MIFFGLEFFVFCCYIVFCSCYVAKLLTTNKHVGFMTQPNDIMICDMPGKVCAKMTDIDNYTRAMWSMILELECYILKIP